jgi:hypothetical protein
MKARGFLCKVRFLHKKVRKSSETAATCAQGNFSTGLWDCGYQFSVAPNQPLAASIQGQGPEHKLWTQICLPGGGVANKTAEKSGRDRNV